MPAALDLERVTPNVYTTTDEIDTFADLILSAVKKGIA